MSSVSGSVNLGDSSATSCYSNGALLVLGESWVLRECDAGRQTQCRWVEVQRFKNEAGVKFRGRSIPGV